MASNPVSSGADHLLLQAQALVREAYDLNPKGARDQHDINSILLRINGLAKTILSSKDEGEEAREALGCLTLAKSLIATNLETRIPDFCLLMNLRQPVTPTLRCPAYGGVQMPTLSTYHVICSHDAGVRLDAEAVWEEVPEAIRNAVGKDCSPENTDLFFSVIRSTPLRMGHNGANVGNVCFHRWAHPTILPGTDVKRKVNMGMFPIMGVSPASGDRDAIAFNALSPINVHSHGDPSNMLYSPNNAHFRIHPDYPFFTCWVVGELDGRTCINKIIGITDVDDPLCRAITTSTRKCPNLFSHMERLEEGVSTYLAENMEPLAKMFEEDPESAMKAFDTLPQWQKNEIFRLTWLLKGSPKGIHGDFGRVSFLGDGIGPEHHCSNAEKAQVIRNFSSFIKEVLVDSQFRLYASRLDMGDNTEFLLTLSTLFLEDGQTEAAMKLFDALEEKDKQGVYRAIWEINGCPRDKGANFGGDRFASPSCPNAERAQALLVYATHCKREFKKMPAPVVADKDATAVSVDASETSGPATRTETSSVSSFMGFYTVVDALSTSPSTNEDILASLEGFDPNFCNIFFLKVFDLAYVPSESSPAPASLGDKILWAKNHLAESSPVLLESFQSSLPIYAQAHITGKKLNELYGTIWQIECQLRGKPQEKDPKWGEHNAFTDPIRLMLALDLLLNS